MRRIIILFLLAFTVQGNAFTVLGSNPAANATSFSNVSNIQIDFDAPFDINSFTENSVAVFGRWSGPASLEFSQSGFGTSVLISHEQAFFPGEYVMVSLNMTCASASGETLEHGYSFGFWVASSAGSMQVEDIGHLQVRMPGEGLIQSYGAYAGDLDHDGYGDLTVVNETAGDMRIFMSDAGEFSTFTIHELPLGNKPSANEGTDFNGDGEIDMVIGNTQGDMMSVVMGIGGGLFGDEVTYTAAQGVRGLAIIDLEGDGDMDVVTANRQGNNLSIFSNDGTGNFSTGVNIGTPLSAETAILSADMNNDGIMDLVVGGYVSDEILVLINEGDGNFILGAPVATGDGPWMIGMGDVDNDGNIDIVAACSGSDQIAIHLGDGAGNLGAASFLPSGAFPLAIDLGDLDGDGDLEVLSSDYAGGTFTLYENMGNGNYANMITLNAEIAGSCAIFHDRDLDGIMDITGIDELADVLIFFKTVTTEIIEEEKPGFSAYPNPAKGSFTLQCDVAQSGTYELIDIQGKKVDQLILATKQSSATWKLDKEIKAGNYLIRKIGSIAALKIMIE